MRVLALVAALVFTLGRALPAAADNAALATARDPLAMIERMRAIVRVDGGHDELDEEPADATVTFTLRAGTRIEVRIVALDANGNRLAEVGSEDVPLVISGAPTETPPPDAHP